MKKSMKSMYEGTRVRDLRAPKPVTLSGWKFYGFAGLLFGTFLISTYPIFVDPVLHADKYKESHKKIQTELFQAGLLPGQLKKWEDPWKK